MVSYGRTFRWTSLDGCVSEYSCSGFESEAACDAIAFVAARKMGWTPPKWWQWWRFNDTPRKSQETPTDG